jgi:hypothetical protein
VTFRFEMQQSGNPYSACPGSSCSNAWMQPGGPLYVGKTFIPTYVMATKFPWGSLQVVKPGNDGILGPPTALPGSGVVVPSGKTVRIPVRASSPGGYPLSVQIVKQPRRGTAIPAPGGIAYTAAPGQSGPDSLVARVSDGLLSSHPVKLSLLVLPPGVSGRTGSVNKVGPVVYGLTAKPRHSHHGRRRRLRLRIDSFHARRLLITVRRHHKVVARRRVKARRHKATVVTLRFKGRHGRYKVTVRPLGRHHKRGKALHQTVRL